MRVKTSGHDLPPLHWLWFMAPMVIFAAVAELWAPDEPRYGEVARHLYEQGNFLVMHLCGAVYPDKPPLLFWLSGLGGWLTDWSEWALRMPSLMATALTAWLVAVLARRWWGRTEARWAPVMFLTFVMVVEIGGRLQIDPLLTVLCVGALVVGSVPTTDPRVRTRGLLAAGLLVGFGVLAKGPVAFINVGVVALGWRLFASDSETRLTVPRWVWPAVVALAVGPALIWALTASMVEPKLFEALFFDQHVGRVTKADRHPGPVWKYVTRLPLLLLPWSLIVWAGLTASWRQWKVRTQATADQGLIRAALWLGSLVLIYSLLPPKRDLYLLSAYPAAALLAARALGNRTRTDRLERWMGWGTAVVVGVIGVILSGATFYSDHIGGLWWRGPAIGLPLFAAGCAAGWATARGRPGAWARSVVSGWLLFSVGAGLLVFPSMNSGKSSRVLAEELAARAENPTEIPCLGDVMPGGYRFYGGIPTVLARELSSHLERDGEDFLGLANIEAWKSLPPDQRALFRVVGERAVGGKQLVILVAAEAGLAASEVPSL